MTSGIISRDNLKSKANLEHLGFQRRANMRNLEQLMNYQLMQQEFT